MKMQVKEGEEGSGGHGIRIKMDNQKHIRKATIEKMTKKQGGQNGGQIETMDLM